MSKFNVGDRVRIIYHYQDPHVVGTVTTIIGMRNDLANHYSPPTPYVLDMPGNELWLAAGEHLQKIGDDFEPSTWEQVEKWTKWNPTKVCV